MSFVLAVLVGAVLGRLRPPSPAAGERSARLVPLAWVAAGCQLAVGLLSPTLREDLDGPALLLTNVLVGLFLVANATSGSFRTAARIAVAGWALNAAVVAANGAMPVSLHAAHEVGIEVDDISEGFLYEHENADRSTNLPYLADVIPVHLGPERSVQSVGDLFLLAGVSVAVATGTRRRADATVPTERWEEVNT